MAEYVNNSRGEADLNKVAAGSKEGRTRFVKLNGRAWRRHEERRQRREAKKYKIQPREPLF